MGKMTEKTFEVLFEYGKEVYEEKLSLDEASKQANISNPEVAISSAKHYITWYSRMKVGDYLTWNSNSDLLVYYAKRIIKEDGREDGGIAISSALMYSKHANRPDLEKELLKIANDYQIKIDTNLSNIAKNIQDFKTWLSEESEKKTHTVNKYVKALKSIEEWMSVSLPKDVFSIESIQEFSELETLIRSYENFPVVNHNRGNGDLSAALSKYREFLLSKESNSRFANDWYPSAEEYDPGITKDQWIELLNDREISGPVWGKALAMFYTEPNGATCSSLAERYGENPVALKNNCTSFAKKVHQETDCPILKRKDGSNSYWPVLFVGKYADSSDKGNYIWKLRPELYEALTEFNIMRFLKEGEEKMNVKETLSVVKNYIASNGFTYDGNLIDNFYLSLKSKPFVILAGTSGTGKTRLVKLFAEAINAEYKLVPIRPDWSDSSDLFGHVDLNGNFVPGAIIDFVKDAQLNPDKPYFLCLDEMNLARVEYYLSDFLSVIETRDRKGGSIVSAPLIDVDKYGSDTEAKETYGEIEYPENLYVVGTVNMDETTFPFSKKVLDRANTIEFSYVDLIPDFTAAETDAEIITAPDSFLKTQYLLLKDCAGKGEYVTEISSELQKINLILQKANLHVGYRVRDEIVFYMLNNLNDGDAILSEDEAFDNALMQKVLPRIQGSSASVRDMLCELFKICGSDHDQKTGDSDSDKMRKVLEDDSIKCRYCKSAEKIRMMVQRFEEDGFTSYWL